MNAADEKVWRAAARVAGKGERIQIADVWKNTKGMSLAEVHRALLNLQIAGKLVLMRNDNPRDVSERDEHAKLMVGGFPRHLVYLEELPGKTEKTPSGMSAGAQALWDLAGKSPNATGHDLRRAVTRGDRAGVAAVTAYVQGKLDNKQGMSVADISAWKALSIEAAHAWHHPAKATGKTTVNSKTRAALIKKIDSEIEKKVTSEMATRKPAKKRRAKKRAKKTTHHAHKHHHARPKKRSSKKRKSHKREATVTLEGLRKGQYKTWTCKGRVRSGCGGGGRVVR